MKELIGGLTERKIIRVQNECPVLARYVAKGVNKRPFCDANCEFVEISQPGSRTCPQGVKNSRYPQAFSSSPAPVGEAVITLDRELRGHTVFDGSAAPHNPEREVEIVDYSPTDSKKTVHRTGGMLYRALSIFMDQA